MDGQQKNPQTDEGRILLDDGSPMDVTVHRSAGEFIKVMVRQLEGYEIQDIINSCFMELQRRKKARNGRKNRPRSR